MINTITIKMSSLNLTIIMKHALKCKCKADYKNMLWWYKIAINKFNSSDAMVECAVYYIKLNMYKKGILLYKKAINLGNIKAIVHYENILHTKSIAFKSKKYLDKLLQYYQELIDKKLPYGYYYMGLQYENTCIKKMLEYYHLGVKNGCARSMCMIGLYYNDVLNDKEQMLHYLMMAVELNYDDAIILLSQHYKNIKNYDKVLEVLNKGIIMCDSRVTFELAEFYCEMFKEISQDFSIEIEDTIYNYDEIVRLYKLAISFGSVSAYNSLANFINKFEYDDIDETQKHNKEVVKYFLTAIKYGNYESAYDLAYYYQNIDSSDWSHIDLAAKYYEIYIGYISNEDLIILVYERENVISASLFLTEYFTKKYSKNKDCLYGNKIVQYSKILIIEQNYTGLLTLITYYISINHINKACNLYDKYYIEKWTDNDEKFIYQTMEIFSLFVTRSHFEKLESYIKKRKDYKLSCIVLYNYYKKFNKTEETEKYLLDMFHTIYINTQNIEMLYKLLLKLFKNNLKIYWFFEQINQIDTIPLKFYDDNLNYYLEQIKNGNILDVCPICNEINKPKILFECKLHAVCSKCYIGSTENGRTPCYYRC